MAVHITHPHAHSGWDSLDMLPQLFAHLEYGRKLEKPGETHTDMWRTANTIQTLALARK